MALPAGAETRGARGRARSALAVLWVLALSHALSLSLSHAQAQDANGTTASAAVYVRTDSDHTTVVTPRVHAGTNVADDTRVDVVYTADVWSSASIDIRTSASKVVTEQRDEIDAAVQHAFTDLTLGASYRYSNEPDYESHGGTLGGTYDFANKNASLSLVAGAFFDQVGRAGDPGFDRSASTQSVRLAFTQVLGRRTFAQLAYDLSRQVGYLSSPYRFVRFATDVGQLPSTCVYPVKMCAPENNPNLRLRHAISLGVRHALSDPLSVGLNYRFYVDDWGVLSNTARVDMAWVPNERWLLSLAYRFYHQGAASYYQPFYLTMPLPAHYTNDKELTTLSSHRVELEISRRFRLDDVGTELQATLLIAPSYYTYDDFLPLDHILALDTTIALGVKL